MRAMFYVLSAASLLALASCATEPKPAAEAPVEGKPGAPQPVQTQPVKPIATPKPGGSPFAALKDPNSILSKRSVYFDFDKFDVKPEFRPLVEAHAKFLRENPSAKMLIQGNADERGSREYNVGLGQRRSDAVKRMLVLLGARDAQLESVSLGEEKPACQEHNEGCWSKNRRGEMLYGGEY